MGSTIEIDHLLTQGLNAYQDGDLPKALKKFEKYLRSEVDSVSVRQAAAYCANKTEAWDRATIHWLKIHQSNSRRLGPIQQYVNALIKQQQWDTAEAFCSTVELFRNGDFQIEQAKIFTQIYLAKGEVAAAVAVTDAQANVTATRDQILGLAEVWQASKYPAMATRLIERLSDEDQAAVETRWLRARIEYDKQDWRAATEVLETLLDSVNGERAQIMLARIGINQNDLDDAAYHYGKVLAANPLNGEAAAQLARKALNDNDPQKAVALLQDHGHNVPTVQKVSLLARAAHIEAPGSGRVVFEEAVRKQPENTALCVAFANYHRELKDFDSAIELTAPLWRADPTDVASRKLHLRILQDQGVDFDLQLQLAQEALVFLPTDINLLNTVGALLARRNREEGAEFYVHATSIVPEAAVLWRNGAYHMLMANRVPDAHAIADDAAKVFSAKDAAALTDLAGIEQAAGRLDRALRLTNRALKKAPYTAKVLMKGVELNMALGNYAKAWQHLTTLEEQQPVRRTPAIATATAKCIAAFRAVRAARKGGASSRFEIPKPVRGKFPEKIFDAAIAMSRPDTSADRSGVVVLTSNLGAGGAERQVVYIMQGLAKSPLDGESCTLVATSLAPEHSHDFFLPELEAAGLGVVDLEGEGRMVRDLLARYPERSQEIRTLSALPAELSRVALPFFALLVEKRPRAVHLWQDAINVAGGIAAAMAGVERIVLCTRSTRPVEIRRYRRYLNEGYKAIFRYSGTVVTVNNSANGARDYEGWLGLEDGTIGVFYNGYDFDSMTMRGNGVPMGKIRKDLGIPAKAKVIGGVMRFSGEKRPDLWVATVIEAVKASQDVYGLIVGDGPMRRSLMTEVAKQNLTDRIHFVGRQSPVEPWMKAMDLLFLSSVTEGLPNVLIEAQAMGRPVMTMDVGGAAETILPGVTGLALQEAAPDVLASQIREVLEDRARITRMSKDAVKHVNLKFGLETMIDTLKDSYGSRPDDGGSG